MVACFDKKNLVNICWPPCLLNAHFWSRGAKKWVKTTIDGLGSGLSPKAIPKAAAAHLASLNLDGCWDTIKANMKNGCSSLAHAGVRTILKRTVSAGRGVIDNNGETGASDSNIHGIMSSVAECVFGSFCVGKSFEGF